MFKPLEIAKHKLLLSDDARIRIIVGAIPESTVSAEFKLPLALLFKYLVANYPGFSLLMPVHRSGFINVSAIPFALLFPTAD